MLIWGSEHLLSHAGLGPGPPPRGLKSSWRATRGFSVIVSAAGLNAAFLNLSCRLFGLKAIILPGGCTQPNKLLLDLNHPWPVYANPGILLLLSYVLATLVKLRRLRSSKQVSPEYLGVTFVISVIWL